MALAMSVPPPSWTLISVSTGSPAWSLRSTTWVSKITSRVSTMGIRLKIPAITALCITASAMDPLSSTAMIMRHWLYRFTRPLKYTRSSTRRRFSKS